MIERIKNYVKQYHMLDMGDSVVMGISGGADSVAMLLAFCAMKEEYKLSLYAVHVNHGIRNEAGEDADYVKKLCEACKVPCYLFEGKVEQMAAARKKTVEEMGREYRYQCFHKIMEQVGAKVLATAHHRGDQAETVLFHLIRGADLSGMAGIRPVSEQNGAFGAYRLIRPLLCCEKRELLEWLTARGVSWQEDATNQDNAFARNRLRNEILPALESVHFGAAGHIADMAGIMWEYEQYFQRLALKYMERHVQTCGGYSWKTERHTLLEQEKVLAKAVIYEMLGNAGQGKKEFTREHVEAVYQLLGNQSGKKIMLPKEVEALNSYENLIIRKCFRGTDFKSCKENSADFQEIALSLEELKKKGKEERVSLPFGGIVRLSCQPVSGLTGEQYENMLKNVGNSKNNYTKFFDCDTIKDTLCIRAARSGDYFIFNEAGNKKKLSRYLLDMHIPVDERQRVLVLACGNEVLYVLGGRRCESFKIRKDTKNILKVTYEGE